MDVHIVDDVCDDNKRNWALQLEFTYPVSQSISVVLQKRKLEAILHMDIYSCLTLLSTKCSLFIHNSIWSPYIDKAIHLEPKNMWMVLNVP